MAGGDPGDPPPLDSRVLQHAYCQLAEGASQGPPSRELCDSGVPGAPCARLAMEERGGGTGNNCQKEPDRGISSRGVGGGVHKYLTRGIP